MNLLPLPKEFVIYDTEYTSWEGAHERNWSGPGEYKELLQIGAIRVVDFVEVDAFQVLVRPVINPVLSDYIITLTGITQSQIDEEGVSFIDAYHSFMEWSNGLQAFSYGPDHNILVLNHELNATGEQVPLERFNDVRGHFEAVGIDSRQYMSGNIPTAFGLVPPPHAHDALNDARSILLALQHLYT